MGQALEPLTHQGGLIVTSDNVTHNLHDWQRLHRTEQATPSYVQEFADWVHDKMVAGDAAALLNYRKTQPSAPLVHARDEHLLTLFIALGAAGPQAQAQAFYRGISDHVIAMDGYVFR